MIIGVSMPIISGTSIIMTTPYMHIVAIRLYYRVCEGVCVCGCIIFCLSVLITMIITIITVR